MTINEVVSSSILVASFEREDSHERQSFCPLKEWITEI